MIPTSSNNEKKEERFQNTPAPYDPLNQCRRCGIRSGKYTDKNTGKEVGVYLLNDARGGKTCNLCQAEGHLIAKKKMTKAEKKQFKKLQKEMENIKGIPHVTLDAHGNEVK